MSDPIPLCVNAPDRGCALIDDVRLHLLTPYRIEVTECLKNLVLARVLEACKEATIHVAADCRWRARVGVLVEKLHDCALQVARHADAEILCKVGSKLEVV